MLSDFSIALIIVSTTLVLTSPIVYIKSILQGKAKPHRTTRFVLLVITVLSTVSLLASSSQVALWLAFASAVQAVAVFALSIKRGMGGWSRLDVTCLTIAMIGVLIWQLTSQPLIGLYASVVADFVGMVPAIVKTYRMPHTEDWRFFAMDTVASVLTIIAAGSFSYKETIYPAYLILINGLMVWLALRKVHSRKE